MTWKTYTTCRRQNPTGSVKIEEIDTPNLETDQTIGDVLNRAKERFQKPPDSLKKTLKELSIPYKEIEWNGPHKTQIGTLLVYTIYSNPIKRAKEEWIVEIRIQN